PNTIRNGIRELKKLNLIIPQSDHYLLNLEEYEKWFYRDSAQGLPNSGRGGLPKSGRAGLPKIGSQEKSSKKKKRNKAEGEIAPIEGTISPTEKAPAQPPANPKSNADSFDEIFPEAKELKSPVKTPEEQLAEL